MGVISWKCHWNTFCVLLNAKRPNDNDRINPKREIFAGSFLMPYFTSYVHTVSPSSWRQQTAALPTTRTGPGPEQQSSREEAKEVIDNRIEVNNQSSITVICKANIQRTWIHLALLFATTSFSFPCNSSRSLSCHSIGVSSTGELSFPLNPFFPLLWQLLASQTVSFLDVWTG